uniref:Uncharacterized protein n=1 Tax=Arundo donax TaxID=35708 RepID=A0A0A9FVG1_ARUDO
MNESALLCSESLIHNNNNTHRSSKVVSAFGMCTPVSGVRTDLL